LLNYFPVKVILENGFLNEEEKVRGSRIAKEAGADRVGTSKGPQLIREFQERFEDSIQRMDRSS